MHSTFYSSVFYGWVTLPRAFATSVSSIPASRFNSTIRWIRLDGSATLFAKGRVSGVECRVMATNGNTYWYLVSGKAKSTVSVEGRLTRTFYCFVSLRQYISTSLLGHGCVGASRIFALHFAFHTFLSYLAPVHISRKMASDA